MERLTSPRIREAMDRGHRTAVVPTGAIEQHGPHLPLLVDAEHASRLGLEVARRLGRALVAPTIRTGCSDHHMAFAGTVSLRRSTFEAVCQDYCASLASHGFEAICLFSAHGGNFRVLAELEPGLNERLGRRCRVVAFSDLRALISAWRETAQEWGGLGNRVGGHADVAEASITAALHPELVDPGAVEPGYAGDIFEENVLNTLLAQGFDTLTPNGILGDPTGFDAELGEQCVQRVAAMLARHFAARLAA